MLFIKVKNGIIYFPIFVCLIVFPVLEAAECPAEKPVWTNQTTNKNFIVDWLLGTLHHCKNNEVDYPSYDGWYHNLAKIDLGSIEQPLLRGWPGMQINKFQVDNWSKVWNHILSITSVCNTSANALSLFLSKQIINEILDTRDPFYSTTEYLNPSHKEQFNYASPYIDGGIIYGKNRYLILQQIESEDGTIDIPNFFELEFKSGYYNDKNLSLVLRMIWLRWHNHIARRIREICPKWASKKVFNEARKWTIAVQQRIYAYEWLPFWTKANLKKYSRYDPTVDPQVEKLFQAAMFIPHSIQDIKNPFSRKKIENKFNNDDLIESLIKDSCQLFSKFEQIENMQQKYNLPDVNHARKVFKLRPYSNWDDFKTKTNLTDFTLLSAFTEQKLEHLDAMMGGTLESRQGTGELFANITLDQFRRIRDGDRFWFENMQNTLFSCEDVVKIGQTTFADVILTVTDIDFESSENNSIFTLSVPQNVQFDNTMINSTFKKSLNTLIFLDIHFYIPPLILVGLMGIGTFCAASCCILRQHIKKKKMSQQEYGITKQALQDNLQIGYPFFPVKEYIGTQEELRRVVVILKTDQKQITVQSFSGTILRVIDFDTVSKTVLKVISLTDEATCIIQFPHNYDLVLKFESNYLRSVFTTELDVFIASNTKLEKELITRFNWKTIKSIIVTKEHRQIWLEMFFRVAFAQAFKIEHSRSEMLKVDAFVAKEVIYTELTIVEFADALSMKPDNIFVKRMFTLVDKDKNGFISFREFVDLLIIFAEGNMEKKAQLLFDLYDINGTGLIPASDFLAMIKSFLETAGGYVHDADIQKTVASMLRSARVENKKNFDFNDFIKIIGDDINNLNYAKLGFKMQKQEDDNSYLAFAKKTIENMYRKRSDLETRFQSFTRAVDQKQATNIQLPAHQSCLHTMLLFCELHSKRLFWMVFLTLLIMFVFVERVYYFSNINKLSGINRYIFGYTRGAKYAMILTYALLFVTMCRNLWTKLRDLLNNKYFPFDCLVPIHVYVAHLSAFFTVIHVIGEILLSYEIMFTSEDLGFILNKYWMNQENLNIHKMFWLNYVVITGVLLTLLLFIVNVFAQSCVRQRLYNAFYFTHNLYPVIIILIIIHSSQLPTPVAYIVLPGPLILFGLDLLISLKRKKIEVPVIRAEFFPSNVLCLVLRRPKNFQYKVGQWVRLAVPQLSRQEFQPAALSAAPHEPYLRIFIPPTNPWACKVHSLFAGPGSGYAAAPVRLLLDGPYGGGAQHWRLCDVVILVGGSSGVAPFAAILKDVGHALQSQAYLHCQKVYFIWVTKTQKHFEWIVDLMQEIEDNDQKHYLSCHIFITQFYERFDLRTIMLYICEKHYQRLSGKSLFTNLRAVTHFGRPAFPEFFRTVQSLHPTAKHVGVFSSGPASLIRAVGTVCSHMNYQSNQQFEHYSSKF